MSHIPFVKCDRFAAITTHATNGMCSLPASTICTPVAVVISGLLPRCDYTLHTVILRNEGSVGVPPRPHCKIPRHPRRSAIRLFAPDSLTTTPDIPPSHALIQYTCHGHLLPPDNPRRPGRRGDRRGPRRHRSLVHDCAPLAPRAPWRRAPS